MFSSECRSKSEPLGCTAWLGRSCSRSRLFPRSDRASQRRTGYPGSLLYSCLPLPSQLRFSSRLTVLLLTPIISVDGGHRHRPLQHHGYCVPLLRRQVFVFHAIFWWFLRLQRGILPAKSLSSGRLVFFLGDYLSNQTSKVALSISFRETRRNITLRNKCRGN